ncbi:M23 family metallopeptidase [Paenibacillus ginsengarvi]|uniref:M23 family metallopeptidase n=1 Tax=Paenibacillus ginsengarvi TaxID=400777 RepID=A0A3B0BTV5_9BACL|nr:M23 family metallopeptidase [Paenibacillus ginsengarvi]RKN75818.1 M23 family metallopeptidase [Paenibacillus ginsengarvi]
MTTEIEFITIHPVHKHAFSVIEHPEGQYQHIGDALGCDCMIEKFVDGFMRKYRSDGKQNEDWYGWDAEVLAPFDGIVESVYLNPVTNLVGEINPSRSSSITFLRNDGVRVFLGHVQNVLVTEGDSVKAGDLVARVGNNGYSRNPHVHIGAWKDKTPLQIRFDAREMGNYFKQLGDRGYHC